jgi:hypothetical protein
MTLLGPRTQAGASRCTISKKCYIRPANNSPNWFASEPLHFKIRSLIFIKAQKESATIILTPPACHAPAASQPRSPIALAARAALPRAARPASFQSVYEIGCCPAADSGSTRVQREPDVINGIGIQLGPKQGTVSGLAGFVAGCHRRVNRVRRQARVWLAQGIVLIAAPAIVCRVIHHRRANGVELDVALTGQKMAVRMHHRGLVAAIPECSGTPVGAVDVLHVATTNRHDEPGDEAGLLGGQQEVHMVGHEHVGVQLAMVVVAALHDVQWDVIELNPAAAGHSGLIAQDIRR